MAFNLSWNVSNLKYYESGIDRGVLFVSDGAGGYNAGVAWEGLISVTDKPGGAEPTDLWANNAKYAQMISAETFEGTIEAYTYPDEFLACDGIVEDAGAPGSFIAQQARTPFGITYRSYVGSDASGQMANYKIHVVYGALVQPSEQAHTTINDSPEAITMSWDFSTTPVAATGYLPLVKIMFDSRTLAANGLTAVEESLYGADATPAALPLPDALLALAATP